MGRHNIMAAKTLYNYSRCRRQGNVEVKRSGFFFPFFFFLVKTFSTKVFKHFGLYAFFVYFSGAPRRLKETALILPMFPVLTFVSKTILI